jgi:hypothetical protein
MAAGVPTVSLILPAFDEATRLARCADRIRAAIDEGRLGRQGTELIVVDDGSTDGTGSIASELFDPILPTRVLRLDENSGKGAAVRCGTAAARAPVVVFMDVDTSVDPRQIPLLLAEIEAADVVIGTRSVEGSVVESCSWHRKHMGRTFNAMVRTLTDLPYLDTQCGFKAFRTPAARVLFHLMRSQRFAFDVEVLALALQLRMTIAEVGIHWREMGESKVRSLADPVLMTRDLIRLRVRHDRPAVPGLVVTPSERCSASHDQVRAEVERTLGPRFPVISPAGMECGRTGIELVVLLPLCEQHEVDEWARRLEASSARLTVRRDALSAAQVLALQNGDGPTRWTSGVATIGAAASVAPRALPAGWVSPVTPAAGPVPA